MGKRTIPFLILAVLAGPSSVASAQSTGIGDVGRVSVVFDGGLAAGSLGAGPAVGGRLTFDLNDRVAIEGAGAWAGRGGGADAGSVTASMLVNLMRADRRTVPYTAIGVGLYRAMFDMGDRRFFGEMGSQYAGRQLVPVAGTHGVGMMEGYTGSGMWTEPWSGPTWDVSQMPMFYLQRMGTMQVPADGRWGMHTFGDPAMSVGGGVRIDVTGRMYVRPEVRALMAFAGGRSNATALITMGIGYRF